MAILSETVIPSYWFRSKRIECLVFRGVSLYECQAKSAAFSCLGCEHLDDHFLSHRQCHSVWP
jgi:hypothetical protein